jgi:hypothetical protein
MKLVIFTRAASRKAQRNTTLTYVFLLVRPNPEFSHNQSANAVPNNVVFLNKILKQIPKHRMSAIN